MKNGLKWEFSMYKGTLASRQKVYNNLYSINKNITQEDKQKGSHAGKRNGQMTARVWIVNEMKWKESYSCGEHQLSNMTQHSSVTVWFGWLIIFQL